MKISVSSYSFAQYINSGKMTQFDCIAKAKELDFDAIEFIDLDGADYDEQLANAKKYYDEAQRVGIAINAYTIGANLYHDSAEDANNEVERLKKQVDIAKALGASVMRHDVCYSLGKTGCSRSFDLMLPNIAKNARTVTEYATALGIKTCSENHGFIAQDSDRVERLFNAVNHDNFGLLVDMGNFACADENSATAVSRVAPYAVHAHAKDMYISSEPCKKASAMTRGGNYFGGAVIGEGDIPVKQCLRILKAAGYNGYISIEYEAEEDCIDGISRGLKNLRQMLSEI